ncbi:MAG: Rieske 2Fe-2S domain-containing protein [Nitriliruptorales bacterium]|nr:Rieske 2Fe-2S domain-containing protein [Nitriliruptorales bacterium]
MNQTPDGTTAQEQWERQRRREDRAARWAAVAFFVAILAGLALLVVYIGGGQTQLEGVLLFVALGGIGFGLGIWVKVIVGQKEIIEERPLMSGQPEERAEFGARYEQALGEAISGGRRRFLIRLLAGAGASLGLALLLPFRSLGPGPEQELFRTAWRQGVRLVTQDGEPIRAEDIIADQVVTVFPEGATHAADAQTVLIGLRPDVETELEHETVDNMVAYSKICTHAGCPVGLYRARVGELLCPCHQSTFGVYRGAVVLSGPAGRPLPQLPIGTDDEGYLVALSDYPTPVGPTFWNLTADPEE